MTCLDFAAHAGCHLCGVCTIPGWQGGLALLSNLERSPMARVLLRGLPAQGGFEAAYYGWSFYHLLMSQFHNVSCLIGLLLSVFYLPLNGCAVMPSEQL